MDQIKLLPEGSSEQETIGVTHTSSGTWFQHSRVLTWQRSAKGSPGGESQRTAGKNPMSRRNPRSKGSEPRQACNVGSPKIWMTRALDTVAPMLCSAGVCLPVGWALVLQLPRYDWAWVPHGLGHRPCSWDCSAMWVPSLQSRHFALSPELNLCVQKTSLLFSWCCNSCQGI